MELEIKFIRTDGGTQARAKLNQDTVDDYRDVLRDSDATWPFPPVVVFHDGSAYWLADGFHRIAAARQHGRFVCEADVRQGTQRDAVLYAAGANADHGLRRTNEDKRRAVLRLLEDAEWGQWSDREIARRCKVSHPFVGFIRAELEPVTGNITSERAYTTKHGTVATMKTGNIGGNGVSEKEPLPYPERCPRPSCQDDFRKYPPKKLGDGRWQCTNCDREFDENGRVPQSVNETESEGDALTAVERQTQLNERAYYWLAEYTDQWGRTWRELEPNQIHHANSPCYQAFVREFPGDRDHKFALKTALARLRQEDEAAVAEKPKQSHDIPLSTIAQLEYFARQGSKSAESIYQELADPTCSGYAMNMEWMEKKTGFSPAVIQEVAAHLATRPRQMANKGEIGLAVGYFLGNLAAGLDEHEAVHVKRSALLSLIRDQKHSVHWAALDLDARLENKPWAIGDLLAVLDIRMRTLEAISGQAELEEAEVEIAPDPAPVARMVLYGDNGQTIITRDLVPAPPAPALDPEARRYDGYQRETFTNEHGHVETRFRPIQEAPAPDPVFSLLKQAEHALGEAIIKFNTDTHFHALGKVNSVYSALLAAIRVYEYGTDV